VKKIEERRREYTALTAVCTGLFLGKTASLYALMLNCCHIIDQTGLTRIRPKKT